MVFTVKPGQEIRKMRCRCTMEELGDRKWFKPHKDNPNLDDEGYFLPDPNCTACKGTGQLPKPKIIVGDGAESTYIGICPLCGYENGIAFEYPNISLSLDDFDKAPCKNKECPNEYCEWINEEDLE